MEKINFKTLGLPLYNFISPYIKEYLEVPIDKNSFDKMMKNGKLEFRNLKFKFKEENHNIKLIKIKDFIISELDILIPDETQKLEINSTGVKFTIEIQSLSLEQFKDYLYESKIQIINKFKEYIIEEIEGKGTLFPIVKNMVNKLLTIVIDKGLTIDIKDININIGCQTLNEVIGFNYERIYYYEKTKFEMGNFNCKITCQDNSINDIIKSSGFTITLLLGEKDNDVNKINFVQLKEFHFNFNYLLIRKINNFISFFLQNKKNYSDAIDSIVFDYKKVQLKEKITLTEEEQNNLSKNYYEQKSTDKVYPINLVKNEILLAYSKKDIEKKLIENKAGKKSFFSFFGGGSDEDKKQLSEKEKTKLDELFQIEKIKQFLNENIILKNLQDFPIFSKILNIANNLEINIKLNSIKALFENEIKEKLSLEFKDVNAQILISFKKFCSLNLSLDDIIKENNTSIFRNKSTKAFKLSLNNNIITNFSLGFKQISITDKILLFFLKFISLFDYMNLIIPQGKETKKEGENKINIDIFKSIIENPPALNIILENSESICLIIKNFSHTKDNSSNFSYIEFECKDNYGKHIILPNTCIIQNENTNEVTKILILFKDTLKINLFKEFIVSILNFINVSLPKITAIISSLNNKNISTTFNNQTFILNCKIDQILMKINENNNCSNVKLEKCEFTSINGLNELLFQNAEIKIYKESLIIYKIVKRLITFPSEEFKEKLKEKKLKLLINEATKETQLLNSEQSQNEQFKLSFPNVYIEYINATKSIILQLKNLQIIYNNNDFSYAFDFFIASLNKNQKNEKKILQIESETKLSYLSNKDRYNLTLFSPILYLDNHIIEDIIDCFTFPIAFEFYIWASNITITIENITIIFGSFNYNIKFIELYDGFENFDKYYFNTLINDLSISRAKIIQILQEKQISLKINFIKVDSLQIILIYKEISVNLLKEDLINLIYLFSKNRKKTNEIKTGNGLFGFNFSFKFTFPKLNLNLCLDESTKFSSLELQKTSVNLSLDKNINFSYSFYIKAIECTFYDSENNSITLLYPFKSGTSTKNSIDEKYQVSVIKDSPAINIQINYLSIMLRLDAIIAIHDFFNNTFQYDLIFKKFEVFFEIELKIHDSEFLLPIMYNSNDIIIFTFNECIFLYRGSNVQKFPYGDTVLSIDSVKNEIVSEKKTRQLLSCPNETIILKTKIEENLVQVSIHFGDITFNLAYLDIISYLYSYQLSIFFYKKEKRFKKDLIPEPSINEEEKKNSSSSDVNICFDLGKFDITLIDNSSNNYSPFLNILLENISILYSHSIQAFFSISIYSYNYLTLGWEPAIEKSKFELNFTEKNNPTKSYNLSVKTQKLLINLSDMSISFVLSRAIEWMKKLLSAKKDYIIYLKKILRNDNKEKQNRNRRKSILINSSLLNQAIISNNTFRNCSGETVQVEYRGEKYLSEPENEFPLKYYKSSNEVRHIKLKFKEKSFNIPIEKLSTQIHSVSKDFFFISEISISKERISELTIYSPIIFHNKTKQSFIINLVKNNSNSDIYIMILEPNKKHGIPFEYQNCIFYISNNDMEPNSNQKIYMDEILNTTKDEVYSKKVNFQEMMYLLILNQNIPRVRTLEIIPEYSIVNCIPIPIRIIGKSKNIIEIDKFSSKEFNGSKFTTMEFAFELNEVEFKTNPIDNIFQNILQEKFKIINFYTRLKGKIQLCFYYTRKRFTKELIIYSHNFIMNQTDNKLDIFYEYKGKEGKCYQTLQPYSFFILNDEDKNLGKLNIFSNGFSFPTIAMKSILEKGSVEEIKSNSQSKIYILNIMTFISSIKIQNDPSFDENLKPLIFSIQSQHQIYNLLKNKYVYICNGQERRYMNKLKPEEMTHFNFFFLGKSIKLNIGISNLNENKPKNWSGDFYGNKCGIFTFFLDKMFIDVEIKENTSNEVVNIFIRESTLQTAKFTFYNETPYFVQIFQRGYDDEDDNIQIVDSNKAEIFKIYSYIDPELMINYKETKNFQIPLERTIKSIGDSFLRVEPNGYKINIYLQTTNKINKKKNEFKFDVQIEEIGISLIGDSEYEKKGLYTYERNEIMFISLNGNYFEYTGIYNYFKITDFIEIKANIKEIKVGNQLSSRGKFVIPFSNNNNMFFNFKMDYLYSSRDKIAEITDFLFKLDKINIGIDPDFAYKLMDLKDNILYRMNINDYKINDIFTKKKDKNYLNKINKEKENSSTIFQGKNLILPKLTIGYEISKINLNKLLKDKFKISNFLSYFISGLAGYSHSLEIKEENIREFRGNAFELLQKIFSDYKNALAAIVFKLGIKGILHGIIGIFGDNSSEKVFQENKRIRKLRAFFGRYKAIRAYNEWESYFYKIIDVESTGYLSSYIQIGNYYYLFTTVYLLIYKNKCFQIAIDYINIKNVVVEDNIVILFFNQSMNTKEKYVIKCYQSKEAANLQSIINEEIKNNKEEMLNIS